MRQETGDRMNFALLPGSWFLTPDPCPLIPVS
jgi:hypothetical protein